MNVERVKNTIGWAIAVVLNKIGLTDAWRHLYHSRTRKDQNMVHPWFILERYRARMTYPWPIHRQQVDAADQSAMSLQTRKQTGFRAMKPEIQWAGHSYGEIFAILWIQFLTGLLRPWLAEASQKRTLRFKITWSQRRAKLAAGTPVGRSQVAANPSFAKSSASHGLVP